MCTIPVKYFAFFSASCSVTIDLEKELMFDAVDEEMTYMKHYEKDEKEKVRKCGALKKGKVVCGASVVFLKSYRFQIIIVNGAESGLTIDRVGGIVESGVERLRTPNVRSGIAYNIFKLRDEALVEQRAGMQFCSLAKNVLSSRTWRKEQTGGAHHMLGPLRDAQSPRERLDYSRREETRTDDHCKCDLEKEIGTHPKKPVLQVDWFRREHDPRTRQFRTMHYHYWNYTIMEGRVSVSSFHFHFHTHVPLSKLFLGCTCREAQSQENGGKSRRSISNWRGNCSF